VVSFPGEIFFSQDGLKFFRVFADIKAWRIKLATQGDNLMNRIIAAIVRFQIWRDNRGQDLIEYALMAGFVAVSAGALMPSISTSISTVFSKVGSVMTGAAG